MARFETLDPEIRGVLGKKVSELGLRVEGSPVEGYVRQLYKELDRRGLKRFRPVCYLTDEWGCPDQQPVLGIPFRPSLGNVSFFAFCSSNLSPPPHHTVGRKFSAQVFKDGQRAHGGQGATTQQCVNDSSEPGALHEQWRK